MEDIECVKTRVSAKKINDETVEEIVRHGFNSMEALSLIAEEGIQNSAWTTEISDASCKTNFYPR